MEPFAGSYNIPGSEWLHGRKKYEYPLERLPETMYRGIPLLEIDAIIALHGPYDTRICHSGKKNGITCSSHCHKGMYTLQKLAI